MGVAGGGGGRKLFKISKIPRDNKLLHCGSGERTSQLGISDLETDNFATNTLKVIAGTTELHFIADKIPDDGLSTRAEGICAAYAKLEIGWQARLIGRAR